MKNPITILLSILLFLPLVLLADDMSVESFKRLDNDMDARINHPEKDPSGRTCAIIKVVNPNTGFVFDTGTVSVVKTKSGTGEIWVYVQPGVKKLTINHPTLGVMRDYYFQMPIEEATVYELRLTTGTVHTYVEQKPSSAFLVVNSVPEGADVFVDGELVGNTPFNKKYNIGQTLQYRISHPLYHDEVGEVKLDKTKTEIITELKKAYGSINVTSNPNGATVFLDNDTEPRGTTPLTIDKVASGPHRVRVKKPKYGQQMIEVVVTDGETANANARLKANFANVTVNTLPGATIKVDDSVKGTGSATWVQDAGLCDIEVSLNGYRNQTRQIQVIPGEPQTITLEPIPMYGILVVESDPAGADIYIDGKKCGETPEVLERVLAMTHTVKITKPGFGDYTTEVSVRENEELGVNGKLSPNVNDISIKSFKRLDNDMDACINHPEKDPSGRSCAIIKVVNPNTGFVFETGTISVVKTRQETGETWVYVQPGVKKLTIKHPHFGEILDYYFPIAIEEAKVYELRLTTGTVQTYIKQKPSSAYLVVNSTPEGADVFVGEEWVGNTPFLKKYNLGQTLQYRVSMPLYHDELGEIKLEKSRNEVNAVLKEANGSYSTNRGGSY